jgi:hypothetical protein
LASIVITCTTISFTSCLKSGFGCSPDRHRCSTNPQLVPGSLCKLRPEIGSCSACASDLRVSSGHLLACHQARFSAAKFLSLSFTSFTPLPLIARVLQVVAMGCLPLTVSSGAISQSPGWVEGDTMFARVCVCTQVSDEDRTSEVGEERTWDDMLFFSIPDGTRQNNC